MMREKIKTILLILMLLFAVNVSNAQENFDEDAQDTTAAPIDDYVLPMVLVAISMAGFKFTKSRKAKAN